jgi:hypothetical protein
MSSGASRPNDITARDLFQELGRSRIQRAFFDIV